MPIQPDKYESLNDAAKILGADAVFHPGMMIDQFCANLVAVIASIPAYVDAEVEKRVTAQKHSAK